MKAEVYVTLYMLAEKMSVKEFVLKVQSDTRKEVIEECVKAAEIRSDFNPSESEWDRGYVDGCKSTEKKIRALLEKGEGK